MKNDISSWPLWKLAMAAKMGYSDVVGPYIKRKKFKLIKTKAK